MRAGPWTTCVWSKDAHEQDIMRRASAISARAHIRAMQTCARMVRAGQDVREYHLMRSCCTGFACTVAVPG
jgi:Xaa-Pro aminopeptidase